MLGLNLTLRPAGMATGLSVRGLRPMQALVLLAAAERLGDRLDQRIGGARPTLFLGRAFRREQTEKVLKTTLD